MLSRVIGGLSEGNVQLAMYAFFYSAHQTSNKRLCSAILSDVTTPENRSKTLAYVGIAFAICFCIGPPIGAYFASQPLPSSINTWGIELNAYATPALITLVLLVLETVFLIVFLPETRGKVHHPTAKDQRPSEKVSGSARANGNGSQAVPKVKASTDERIRRLSSLRRLHFLFLGLFSGVEFTLTFLTFDCKSQSGEYICPECLRELDGMLQYLTGTTHRMGS